MTKCPPRGPRRAFLAHDFRVCSAHQLASDFTPQMEPAGDTIFQFCNLIPGALLHALFAQVAASGGVERLSDRCDMGGDLWLNLPMQAFRSWPTDAVGVEARKLRSCWCRKVRFAWKERAASFSNSATIISRWRKLCKSWKSSFSWRRRARFASR